MKKLLRCPNCGSTTFRSEPVGFDIVKMFTDGRIEIIGTDSYDNNGFICNECLEEIDLEKLTTKS